MSAALIVADVRRDEANENIDNANNNNIVDNNENGDDSTSSSASSVVPLDDAPDVVAPPPAPVAPAAPTLRQNLARIWHAVGRKQVEVWRTGGAVRAVAYYALATAVVTGISWAVEQEHTCSVPVWEWLAAHVMIVLVRFVAAFAILYISRQAQLFERRRSLLGIISRVTDACLLLLCVVGLSYVVSTASGDCPSSAPYQYRALALLVTFESLAVLLAVFVGGCMLAGGWAGGRGLRVPGFNFNGVAQQLEASNGRGATYDQIVALPLRRFVKSSAVAEKRDASTVEAADAIEDLQPKAPLIKPKRIGSDSESVSSDDAAANDNNDDEEDSEMSLTCAVCLGEYEAGELVRVLPCKHYFHRECIDTWLARNKTCPFCKHSIDEAPPAHSQLVNATTMAETASTDAED